MTRNDYQAGAPGNATVERDGERWTLVFVRELPYAPEHVWRALTDPDELREWAPFDPERNLASVGKVALTMAGGDGEASTATILRADAPRRLEYLWESDLLRWELEPIATGTRLTLRHTPEDRAWLPKVAAGWQICLDVAERAMAGHPIGRIAGPEARKHGWERLHEAFAARFGMALV